MMADWLGVCRSCGQGFDVVSPDPDVCPLCAEYWDRRREGRRGGATPERAADA